MFVAVFTRALHFSPSTARRRCFKGSVQVQGPVSDFEICSLFTVWSCYLHACLQRLRTVSCHPCATVYSVYSQLRPYLEATSSICNLRMSHAVMRGAHLSWSIKSALEYVENNTGFVYSPLLLLKTFVACYCLLHIIECKKPTREVYICLIWKKVALKLRVVLV
jgi:hypothetical protein